MPSVEPALESPVSLSFTAHSAAEPVAVETPGLAIRPILRNSASGCSLGDLYCEGRGLPREDFVDHFLRESLYPMARFLYPFIRWFVHRVDKGDRDLIADLGACASRSSVRRTLSRLPNYYDDWNFWRSTGKLRVSSRRVLVLVAEFGIR